MNRLQLTTFFLLLWFSLLFANEKSIVIDSMAIKNEKLVVSLHANGIFDEKLVSGLRQGLTNTFRYEIQLWEKRSIWVNNLITTHVREIKVYFDNWDKKFMIITPEEKRLTSSLATVKRFCTLVIDFPLVPRKDLSAKKRYFITIKLVQKPLSLQNYREIKNWLSGKARSLKLKDIGNSDKKEEKVKTGFLKLLLSVAGFGDKIISRKSEVFKVQGDLLIFEK